jgi:hypothetical protein
MKTIAESSIADCGLRIADLKNCGMDGADPPSQGFDAASGVKREGGMKSGEDVDLGLAVLFCLRRRGERMSYEAIAAATGLNEMAVHRIERRALDKLLEVPGLKEVWLEECKEAEESRKQKAEN